MSNSLATQRLIGLFGAGVLVFNFPLLALWDRNATLLGIPLFPAALFIVWLVLIGALGWIVETLDDDPPDPPDLPRAPAAGAAVPPDR
jgi:hypothetical protein